MTRDGGAGEDAADAGDGALGDGGLTDVSVDGFEGCGETGRLIVFLEERCASGSCHGGRRFPTLTREAFALLPDLMSEAVPGEPLVVPGDPEGSFLYRKLAGTHGDAGALMPLGVDRPIAERAWVEAWIEEGAPTECDEPLPPTRVPYDPNTLDPDELFTCADPAAPRSSPSRLRRVERQEFTHAVVRQLGGTWWGSTVRDNPLSVPEGFPYSTYTDDLSLDPATLDLFLLYLDEAAVSWSTRDPIRTSPPGVRMTSVYDDRSLWCVSSDASPSAECLERFVDTLLRRGMLFREPTADERSRVIARISSLIDSTADRENALHVTAKSTLLMTYSLFREEIGEGDGARRRLSANELALALGHVLSTHPVGAPFVIGSGGDGPFPELGRLGAIRAAADDGTIFEASTRRDLLRLYASGVDPSRAADDADPNRGEYWLAPMFARFFREYFDYNDANTSFKDTPGATSLWDTPGSGGRYDPSNLGFGNLQSVYYGDESTLVDQLDDTIARAVIESDASGEDVFAKLLTTNLWRLPSNLTTTNGRPCSERDDCGGAPYDRCTSIGLCGTNISNSVTPTHRVYGLTTNVPDTPEGRWVNMEAPRLGILTHPAWLAAHGGNFEDDASLVLRGKWVREHLFCQTVPPLELVMVEAQLVESDPSRRARDRVRVSIEEGEFAETCQGCHRQMNPLGVAFEEFNHAGFTRADDHGRSPDGSTVIDNLPDPALNRAYDDAADMVTAFASSSYARRGFLRHLFRFFMGRDEVLEDGCTLTEMEDALDDSGSFFAVVEALVSSETFTHRHLRGAE